MTDNSNVVLLWEINHARAVHAAGKVESRVFNEGGFKWTVMAERIGDRVKLALKCGVDHSGTWKCEADVSVLLYAKHVPKIQCEQEKRIPFNASNDLWNPRPESSWHILTHRSFNINDKVTYEFHIHIITSECGEPVISKFTAPNSMSNVILKIGEQKLHVCKEYLSVQSPFFERLFFGNFVEKGKDEVEMKDVVFEEFVDLLNVIYLVSVNVTDRNSLHILKLADRFEMKYVIEISEKYLMQSKGIDVVKKLIAADKYRLADLKDHCLKSFTSIAELSEKLKASPEAVNFSDEMKAAIFDLNFKLKLQ